MKRILIAVIVVAAVIGGGAMIYDNITADKQAENVTTAEVKGAIKESLSYGMSKQNVIGDLTLNQGYSESVTKELLDEMDIDWNKQAVMTAKAYVNEKKYANKEDLVKDLVEIGMFTKKQAEYAAGKVIK